MYLLGCVKGLLSTETLYMKGDVVLSNPELENRKPRNNESPALDRVSKNRVSRLDLTSSLSFVITSTSRKMIRK
jgi:hypothetical protein